MILSSKTVFINQNCTSPHKHRGNSGGMCLVQSISCSHLEVLGEGYARGVPCILRMESLMFEKRSTKRPGAWKSNLFLAKMTKTPTLLIILSQGDLAPCWGV